MMTSKCPPFLLLLSAVFKSTICSPISQPGYENTQYAQAQAIPTVQYKPQAILFKPQHQPQTSRPVYEARAEGLQYYSSQQKGQNAIQTPAHRPVQQVFLPTNQGPRQVEPSFYDQVLKAQQQSNLRRSQPTTVQQQQQQQPIYQPQQIKYPAPQAQPQYSAKYQQPQERLPKPQRDRDEDREEEEGDYDPNPSYQFGFDVKDDQYTNYQTRSEERDGKKITGSYSVVDADGFIRTVKYTADPKEGFKAEVTRQPTDIVVKIPKPEPQYQRHQPVRQQPQYVQAQGPQRAQQRAPDESSNVVYRYQ